MDISSSGATRFNGIQDPHGAQRLDPARRRVRENGYRGQGADEAVISSHGQLLQKLGEAVDRSSDVREEKVAELRSAIQQGRYQLSYEEVAKAILASRVR